MPQIKNTELVADTINCCRRRLRRNAHHSGILDHGYHLLENPFEYDEDWHVGTFVDDLERMTRLNPLRAERATKLGFERLNLDTTKFEHSVQCIAPEGMREDSYSVGETFFREREATSAQCRAAARLSPTVMAWLAEDDYTRPAYLVIGYWCVLLLTEGRPTPVTTLTRRIVAGDGGKTPPKETVTDLAGKVYAVKVVKVMYKRSSITGRRKLTCERAVHSPYLIDNGAS